MKKILLKISLLIITVLLINIRIQAGGYDSLLLDKPLLFLWHSNIQAEHLATTDEKILVSQPDGHLTTLSSSDGKILWKVNLGGNIKMTPLITKSTIFTPTNFSNNGQEHTTIRSLNIETGTTNWKSELQGILISYYTTDDNKVLYCLLNNGELITLDKSNGEIVSTFLLPNRNHKTKYFLNDSIILYINEQSINAFSILTKRFVWNTSFKSPLNNSFTSIGDNLIVNSSDNYLHFVNIYTGNIVWRKRITTSQQTFFAAKNGILVTNTENKIFFLTLDGKLKWKKILDGKFTGMFLIQKDSLLLFTHASNQGIVFDISKGYVLNRVKIDESNDDSNFVQLPPATTGKTLIIQTQNGLNAYSN